MKYPQLSQIWVQMWLTNSKSNAILYVQLMQKARVLCELLLEVAQSLNRSTLEV